MHARVFTCTDDMKLLVNIQTESRVQKNNKKKDKHSSIGWKSGVRSARHREQKKKEKEEKMFVWVCC